MLAQVIEEQSGLALERATAREPLQLVRVEVAVRRRHAEADAGPLGGWDDFDLVDGEAEVIEAA